MTKKMGPVKDARSDGELAQMIANIAQSVGADAVICGTETGGLIRYVQENAGELRLIAATPNADTYDALQREGFDVVRLSVRVTQKYTQARHAAAMALNSGAVTVGDLVVCGIGQNLCRGSGDLVLVTDVEVGAGDVRISELIKLTDGIRPDTLETALKVGCTIARVARRGKSLGALFVLGDSGKILEGSRQLILNPFEGHEDANRTLLNPSIHDMLVELAKLDGAFVIRGDGFIETVGVFLAGSGTPVEIPAGLGARHLTAAAVTARSRATAVVVSSTDGYVRVFSHGDLVLQMDPEVPVMALPRKAKT